MSDEQLLTTAAYASEIERYAFLLRGACASELRKRVGARLAGGRGKRDEAGVGIQSKMECLATGVSVDVTTLRTNTRIYETFFAGRPGEETALARAHSLPREYYVIALAAPDPRAAVELAVAARRVRPYTRRQFRADIRALKRPAPAGDAGRQSKVVLKSWGGLPRKAQRVLSDLCRATGKGPGEKEKMESGRGYGEVVAGESVVVRKRKAGGRAAGNERW